MAVPNRVYVGIVVFGLIASLLTLAYALVLLSGYTPPATSPYELLFPEDRRLQAGEMVFLALTALFSTILTVFSWRALLSGARRDMARLRRHQELKKEIKQYARSKRQQPPGTN